jgi:charged multivesicular body protein 4
MRQCTYIGPFVDMFVLLTWHRDKLREQHALGEEIAQAITSAPIGEPVDEDELDSELAELEQEQLDNRMLKTGTVPVADEIHRLPAAANGERKGLLFILTSDAN